MQVFTSCWRIAGDVVTDVELRMLFLASMESIGFAIKEIARASSDTERASSLLHKAKHLLGQKERYRRIQPYSKACKDSAQSIADKFNHNLESRVSSRRVNKEEWKRVIG
jgi:hypothetical protein